MEGHQEGSFSVGSEFIDHSSIHLRLVLSLVLQLQIGLVIDRVLNVFLLIDHKQCFGELLHVVFMQHLKGTLGDE